MTSEPDSLRAVRPYVRALSGVSAHAGTNVPRQDALLRTNRSEHREKRITWVLPRWCSYLHERRLCAVPNKITAKRWHCGALHVLSSPLLRTCIVAGIYSVYGGGQDQTCSFQRGMFFLPPRKNDAPPLLHRYPSQSKRHLCNINNTTTTFTSLSHLLTPIPTAFPCLKNQT
jgi:hypothetical protein